MKRQDPLGPLRHDRLPPPSQPSHCHDGWHLRQGGHYYISSFFFRFGPATTRFPQWPYLSSSFCSLSSHQEWVDETACKIFAHCLNETLSHPFHCIWKPILVISFILFSSTDCGNQEWVDEAVGEDFADHRERNSSQVSCLKSLNLAFGMYVTSYQCLWVVLDL